jgi:hypothetical protein
MDRDEARQHLVKAASLHVGQRVPEDFDRDLTLTALATIMLEHDQRSDPSERTVTLTLDEIEALIYERHCAPSTHTSVSLADKQRVKNAGYIVERFGDKGWTLCGPDDHSAPLMVGSHGCVSPTAWECFAEAIKRIEQDLLAELRSHRARPEGDGPKEVYCGADGALHTRAL